MDAVVRRLIKYFECYSYILPKKLNESFVLLVAKANGCSFCMYEF